MKMSYYKDTDTLYIEIDESPSSESMEISEGVVFDYDSENKINGIEIENASMKFNLKKLADQKILATF